MADEITIEALKLPVIGNLAAFTESLPERSLQQIVTVNVGKGRVNRLLRNARRDTGGLDRSPDSQLAATLHDYLGPRDRVRDACIVDGTFLLQAFDGGLDVGVVVMCARQALPNMRFG